MKRIFPVVLLLLSASAWADKDFTTVSSAKGQAAIENNNKPAARQQALDQALRDALSRGAGTVIDSATVVEGNTLGMDKIFSHANGYIKHYDVANESAEDGIYTVELSNVVVGTADLSKDVAAIRAHIAAQGHPRIMLMISEQSIEEAAPRGWWVQGQQNVPGKEVHSAASISSGVVEQSIISHLSPLGWKFIDPQVASEKIKVAASAVTDFNNQQAREYGKMTGAEYVVLGSVLVRPEEQASGLLTDLRQVNIRMNLRAVKTDNGEVVATASENRAFPNIEDKIVTASISDSSAKGMEKFAQVIAEALQKQVLEDFRRKMTGDANYHMAVSVADYDVLSAFEDVLKASVANVKSVDEVSFSDGKADLSLMFTGSTKNLAGSLSNKSVKGYNVKVTKVTPNTLEVKLAK